MYSHCIPQKSISKVSGILNIHDVFHENSVKDFYTNVLSNFNRKLQDHGSCFFV